MAYGPIERPKPTGLYIKAPPLYGKGTRNSRLDSIGILFYSLSLVSQLRSVENTRACNGTCIL